MGRKYHKRAGKPLIDEAMTPKSGPMRVIKYVNGEPAEEAIVAARENWEAPRLGKFFPTTRKEDRPNGMGMSITPHNKQLRYD